MKILKRIGLFSLGPALVVLAIFLFLVLFPKRSAIPYEENTEPSYYLSAAEAALSKDIERSFISNSGQNFFVRGEQLRQVLRVESALSGKKIDRFFNGVTFAPSLQPQNPILYPDICHTLVIQKEGVLSADAEGTQKGERVEKGETLLYDAVLQRADTVLYHTVKGYVEEDAAAVVYTRREIEGSRTHPYPLSDASIYYGAFCRESDEIYFSLTFPNEYVSLFAEGLPDGTAYELYNKNYRKLSAGYCGADGKLEIRYKGSSMGNHQYFLRLSGPCTETPKPFTLRTPTDQNTWDAPDKSLSLTQTASGRVDYYGDEDYFVLQEDVAKNISHYCLRVKQFAGEMTVSAYNADGDIIGRYYRNKAEEGDITLYGLEEVYALSVRTKAGDMSSHQYRLELAQIEAQILGIETFGFVLSPVFDSRPDGENYYTATVADIQNKRISDIQVVGDAKVSVTMETYSGARFAVSEDTPLPLHHGKSTLTITVELADHTRVITVVLTDTESYTMNFAYVSGGTLNLRQDAREASRKLGTVKAGTKVWDLGNRRVDGDKVYAQIELCDGSGTIGWVLAAYLKSEYSTVEPPSSYADAIAKLQARHPNWKFTFVDAGKSFSDMVDYQMKGNNSKVNNRKASRSQVEHYLDPRNFLNDTDIFMFERQNYQSQVSYSTAGISAIWNEKKGTKHSKAYYVSALLEAGKISGLSPYFVAARAALESGYGTSKLANGTITGAAGYYNFYGIAAVDANPSAGGGYAQGKGWNTQRRAIVEGADWIKNNYVSALQYTPYFLKFSLVSSREWHQYMTDLQAPLSDAKMIYKAHAYGGTLDAPVEFVIPVYRNMP